jgi:MSHA biogenesis protein MshN
MSVINQVLKDLDRQGANVSAPNGVIAVNQRDAPPLRWPWLLPGLLALAAAAWWFWPAAPGSGSPAAPAPTLPPAAPQLRLSQQLSPMSEPAPVHVGRNPGNEEAASVSAEAQRLRSSMAPSAIHAHSAENATLFRPTQAVVAVIPATKPRLDTRLPEPRPSDTAKALVVKEIKPLTPQAQAEDAWRQASRLLEQGREHDAQERLEYALRLDPNHAGAHQSLIALLLEAGASAESAARAEALLREGLALHPNEAWYPRSLAQLHLQRGDATAAAAILKASLAARPDAANWGLYASTLAKLGKPGDAAQAYREALRLNPAQGAGWIGLAVALEQSGDKNEAAAAYQRALQTRLSAELHDFAQQKARELGAR